MFKNYLLIAMRNLLRNKLYSLINIGGLAVGITIFVFVIVFVQYEKTHDTFYEKVDRTYTLGSIFSPTANVGVKETDGVYTAMAPFLQTAAPEIEAVARIVQRDFLLSMKGVSEGNDRNFYQEIKFTDKGFLKIFDLDYIAGDASALNDPSGIILTETLAKKLFPESSPMGQVISLDHETDLRVTAVIKDIPKNSHHVSSVMFDPLQAIALIDVLNKTEGYELEGDWSNLSGGDLTYVLLPPTKNADWLSQKANGVLERNASDITKEFISGIRVRPLQNMNLVLWEIVGWPVMDLLVVLAFMILVIASLNYTNLATAQALGRAKEVGLRKTVGANIKQLLSQFLVESTLTAIVAMWVSLALLELIIPYANGVLDKAMVLSYATWLPTLFAITLLVGLIAGGYPAYIITRVSPIDALNETLSKGSKGSMVRSVMIGAQFVFSVFMLAVVSVVYFQNKKVEESSNIFPKSQIVTLQRMGVETMRSRFDTLKHSIKEIPGVQNAAYASQVPFEQRNSTFRATKISGDAAGKLKLNGIYVDYDFLSTYDIPIIAGRNFSREFGNDVEREESTAVNVIVNELTLKRLGIASAQSAINETFFQLYASPEDEGKTKAYTIVGVMPDQNFMGLHNDIRPIVFRINPSEFEKLSLRISGSDMASTMAAVERAWEEVIPDYPIQIQHSEDIFDRVFRIFNIINMSLTGLAFTALTLAFIGLFGLAAFMAEQRTKEIGLRKVLGAETYQIIMLLIWQLSRPVMWSLVIALPLSYFATGAYLDFFADRIESGAVLVLAAGVSAIALAWIIVSLHAIRISRTKPIVALRYE